MLNELKQRFAVSGAIEFSEISPGFIHLKITNEHAHAVISLYGGQLLEFKPHDQHEPLIWLSEKAVFQQGKAIRGGIPVCWPWFGEYELEELEEPAAESMPAHGYARISHWQLDSVKSLADGQTELLLHLPQENIPRHLHAIRQFFHCQLALKITIGKALKLELISHNHGLKTVPLTYALHSYFNISNIHDIELIGLEQQTYLDKLNAGQAAQQTTALRFAGETDRVFIDSDTAIRLIDTKLKRSIVISKENSHSSIIWNPWQETSARMSDMTEPGWLSMVCIEAANVAKNKVLLGAGETQRMKVTISAE